MTLKGFAACFLASKKLHLLQYVVMLHAMENARNSNKGGLNKNYQRYLEMAKKADDSIAAQFFYQYAEHYCRTAKSS